MEKPFFSIIINNFNYAQYLRTAIDSALGQSYGNYEVVVVDDGSTDNSAEIIKSYDSKIIQIFKKNGGQCSTFNAGFKKSKGDLIWFLDSDDYLNPEALTAVSKHYNKTVSLYYTRLQLFDSKNDNLGLIPSGELPHQGNIFDTMQAGIRDRLPPTSALIFSRIALNKCMPIEPEETFKYSPDIFLSSQVCFLGSILGIDIVSGNYRIHPKNHTYLAEFDISRIKKRMIQEIHTHSIRFQNAKSHNLSIPEDYAIYDIGHTQNRLLHYILKQKEHPVPYDSRYSLLKQSFIVLLKTPHTSIPKKIVRAIKFTIFAISPSCILLVIIKAVKRIRKRKY